ncbi:hypothetical protein [Nonomuraea turcica]|uniref:hypothetical protein n=1 Tax=Nonomuraea sp. G32 TaxID=3067274 RepID=UPI00273C51DC|nr:hypothetical protein [Nonomuraea sp. G32]MDP4511483.1 hypothetical protein [Nonomuraea sp. G32]
MAACLKGFYLHQAAFGVNRELGQQLSLSRLPTRADRAQLVVLAHESGLVAPRNS